jgi:hypothetical protein
LTLGLGFVLTLGLGLFFRGLSAPDRAEKPLFFSRILMILEKILVRFGETSATHYWLGVQGEWLIGLGQKSDRLGAGI